MQEDNVYEYAVIRLVPKVEREEFINIGLVMFSKKAKFIEMQYSICPIKFEAMRCSVEFDEIATYLSNFKKIANGDKSSGPIAALDIPERFRWLTAVRSAIIQTSSVHPGKSRNLQETFNTLFAELVL